MKAVLWRSAASWELTALPLFIWIGEIMFRTDMSARLFQGLSPLVRKVPGGLIHANILGCTLFSSVCGSSTATTATVGKITLASLFDRGYNRSLSMGSLAGAGTLGLMIPPSIVMIVYGVLGEVSITRLFAAGVVPGLLLAALSSAYIALRAIADPKLAPTQTGQLTLREIWEGLRLLLPVLSIILVVFAGLYSGFVTPAECAALGVVATFGVCIVTRQLSWRVLVDSLMGTVRITSMVCAIVISAGLLSTTVGYMHIPTDMAKFIAELSMGPYELILAMAVFYFILGGPLDGISMTVMTLPVVLPLVTGAGFDPVWFGVFLIVMVEIAQLTPPIGFNLNVIQGLTGERMGDIAWSSMPFFLIMCMTAVLLVLFPEIALWLPNLLYGPASS